MGIYKESLSKEDFKLALSECFKKTWIWHSFENFKQALKWKDEKIFTYPGKEKMESDADYNNDASTIDLFALYKDLQATPEAKDFQTFLGSWEDVDGFSVQKFLGETIEDGNEVGQKARELFTILNAKQDKHQLVGDFSEIINFNAALEATNQLLANSQIDKYTYLFEPAFSYDENHLKTRCDILKLKGNKHVEIIEIKATSQVKEPHFFDLAYQIFVLEKNGFVVDNVYLGHLRDNFILGVSYNPTDLVLSDQAKELFAQTPKISFEEAQKVLASLPNNQQFPEELLDVSEDLEYFFEIDEFYRKGSLRTPAIKLMNAYRELEHQGFLEELFLRLTNLMAMNLQQVQTYFQKPFCETKLKYSTQKKNGDLQGWIFETKYCSHVVRWFDEQKENVFHLTGTSNFSNAQKAKVYWENQIVYLDQIPSLATLNVTLANKDEKKTFFLPQHFRHFEIYKAYSKDPQNFQESEIINNYDKAIGALLKPYENYPIYMYDFETAKWAVPRFYRSKAYQQIPFQYSIDVLLDSHFDYKSPQQTLDHFDFLANKIADPRPEFIRHFLKDIFSRGPGTYVAYNDAFEKTVLKYLAWAFPQFAIPLLYVVQNTIDLMDFFKGKKNSHPWFAIYHPLFHGSYSIKKTQPALDAAFSYENLTINKGDKASQTFREYLDKRIPKPVWEKELRKDMLEYCNHDTLAMVVILQRVREIYADWERRKNDQI